MKGRVLSIILVLCLALSLAACGGPKFTNADFVGTWTSEVEVTDSFKSGISQQDLSDAFGGIDTAAYLDLDDLKIPEMPVVLKLKDDDTFVLGIDESFAGDVCDAVAKWITDSDMEGIVTEILKVTFEANGLTMEEAMEAYGAGSVSELIEMSLGMTLEEYSDSFSKDFSKGMDGVLDFSAYESSGTWKYSSGKVVLSSNKGGGELIFNEDLYTLTMPSTGEDDPVGTLVFLRK